MDSHEILVMKYIAYIEARAEFFEALEDYVRVRIADEQSVS